MAMNHRTTTLLRTALFCFAVLAFFACHDTSQKDSSPRQSPLTDSEFTFQNPHTEKVSEDECVVLADSLTYSPAEQSNRAAGYLLYACIFTALGSLILSLYKRRDHNKQIRLLQEESSTSKQALSNAAKQISENRNELFNLHIRQSDIYKEITSLIEQNKDGLYAKQLLTPDKWRELMQTIDSHSDDFTKRLQGKHPLLKPEDIHFCCLIKIGLKYAEAACILGRTPNMMYKRRDIISRRMESDMSGKALDKYIENF